MDKFNSYLTEWVIHYTKNKDLLIRNIKFIEENREDFNLIVNFKDRKQYYIVRAFIENINEILEMLNNEDDFGLVVFNTKDNFKIIISNWDNLAKFKKLSIFFVNPFSKLDKLMLSFVLAPRVENDYYFFFDFIFQQNQKFLVLLS